MNARYALILAAGKGTRFNSDKPKVLHPLCGKPMIAYLLDRMPDLGITRTFVVVGEGADQVEAALGSYDLEYVHQEEQRGTGHAVMTAVPQLKGLSGSLLVLYGDTPLIDTRSMLGLMGVREESQAAEVLLTVEVEDPCGYGRIVRDGEGRIMDIVEEKDASAEQKLIREINPGFVCFDIQRLSENIFDLSDANRAGEYYLTDMVKILYQRGEKVESMLVEAEDDLIGINDRRQLAQAESRLRQKINRDWMEKGVSLKDPSTTYIDSQVELAPGCMIYPGVTIEGNSRIGQGCRILSHAHLENAELETGVFVDHSTIIRDSFVGAGSRIGPHAHLRDACRLGSNVRLGNFVEAKNTSIGPDTTAAHLSYLGDSRIGSRVNIGAGTITCNFDGRNKNVTIIEDECFIGSGCQLIAPVTIEKGSTVAAGSTITEDVPAGSLALARSRQSNKAGWKRKTEEPRRT